MSHIRLESLPDIIAAHEAAKILGLSKRQTIRLAQKDQVEAKLLSKQWVFSKASVEKLKAQREKSDKK